MVTPRFLFISPTCFLEQGTDACGGIQSVVTAHQQNQNYREPLCTFDQGSRGKYLFYWFVWKWNEYCVEQGCHGQKWVNLNFVYTFERTKIKPVWIYGTHRFNQILSLQKLFRVCRSLQMVPATERCNNTLPGLWWVKTRQHVARPLRSFSGTHLIPMLSTFHHVCKETKGRKSWVKHNTFFACSKAVNNKKKIIFCYVSLPVRHILRLP